MPRTTDIERIIKGVRTGANVERDSYIIVNHIGTTTYVAYDKLRREELKALAELKGFPVKEPRGKSMTRAEYVKWAEENIDFGDGSDPEVEGGKAKAKFEELTAGRTVEIVVDDWKCHGEHLHRIIEAARRLETYHVEDFPDFWEFPHGQLDDLIAVVSREPMDRELAEVLADLVVNLGA